jgi:PBS lyase HEAT-like repeat-containing protein
MSNKASIEAGRCLTSSGSSLLDRSHSSQVNPQFTESQSLVDRTVSQSVEEIAKPETMLALLGAGGVSRLTRIGVMSAVPLQEGKVFLPLLAKGGSYALSLANESAAFAGIERGFGHLEGRPSTESFEKAWARSAVSLGSLKFFGKVTEGQNIVLQHLSSNLGLVGAQNLGHAFQITDGPRGTLVEQMLQAEAMNWKMKGSMALLHGLSPNLFATERSLDLYLKNQETEQFFQWQSSPFFSQLMMAGNGGRGTFSVNARRAEELINKMSSTDGEGEGGPGKKGPEEGPQVDITSLAKDPGTIRRLFELFEAKDPTAITVLAKIARRNPEAIHKLAEIAKAPSRDTAETIRELTELAEAGNSAATAALAQIATAKPEAVDAVAAVARVEIVGDSREEDIRTRAAKALGKLGDPTVLTALQSVLNGEERAAIFPGAEIFEITLQQNQITATLLSKRADQSGGMDPPAFIPELHIDFAREVLEVKGIRAFFLKWKGDDLVPKGAKILGHEIGSTDNGLVRNVEGEVIGVYDRVFGGGPKSGLEQQIIIYIKPPHPIVEIP